MTNRAISSELNHFRSWVEQEHPAKNEAMPAPTTATVIARRRADARSMVMIGLSPSSVPRGCGSNFLHLLSVILHINRSGSKRRNTLHEYPVRAAKKEADQRAA